MALEDVIKSCGVMETSAPEDIQVYYANLCSQCVDHKVVEIIIKRQVPPKCPCKHGKLFRIVNKGQLTFTASKDKFYEIFRILNEC